MIVSDRSCLDGQIGHDNACKHASPACRQGLTYVAKKGIEETYVIWIYVGILVVLLAS